MSYLLPVVSAEGEEWQFGATDEVPYLEISEAIANGYGVGHLW